MSQLIVQNTSIKYHNPSAGSQQPTLLTFWPVPSESKALLSKTLNTTNYKALSLKATSSAESHISRNSDNFHILVQDTVQDVRATASKKRARSWSSHKPSYAGLPRKILRAASPPSLNPNNAQADRYKDEQGTVEKSSHVQYDRVTPVPSSPVSSTSNSSRPKGNVTPRSHTFLEHEVSNNKPMLHGRFYSKAAPTALKADAIIRQHLAMIGNSDNAPVMNSRGKGKQRQEEWKCYSTPRWSEAGSFKLRVDECFGEGNMLRGFEKRPQTTNPRSDKGRAVTPMESDPETDDETSEANGPA